jgi:hypothetical protein
MLNVESAIPKSLRYGWTLTMTRSDRTKTRPPCLGKGGELKNASERWGYGSLL